MAQEIKNNRLIYYTKIDDWEKIVEILSRKSGVDVNCRDESDWTPLHFGCSNRNTQLVTLLLARQSGIDAKTNSGYTPVMVAAQKGAHQIVTLLLTAGANPNCQDQYSNTALHYACLANFKDVVTVLLQCP